MYISINGTLYTNNSVIPVTEIGETDPLDTSAENNGIQCITDKMPCCGVEEVGEWLFPSGQVVPGLEDAVSFYVNRGKNDGTVNLNRLSDSMVPTGMFCCVIPDALENTHYVCVGVASIDSEGQ